MSVSEVDTVLVEVVTRSDNKGLFVNFTVFLPSPHPLLLPRLTYVLSEGSRVIIMSMGKYDLYLTMLVNEGSSHELTRYFLMWI